jgi:F0F1-type ATP synthase membrane subunit b/b'
LAKAEHDAADTLRSAEKEAEARINAKRQQLEQEAEIQYQALQKQFDQEWRNLLDEIESEKERIARQTEAAVLKIQQSHQNVHDQLVEWLVNKVAKG